MNTERRMGKFSQQIEDYLKAIYLLQQRTGGATTNGIAEALAIRPASVTGMLKKLTELNLTRHTPYQGVTLTKPGEKAALEVVRHHRLIELFLADTLGHAGGAGHI